MCWTKAAREFVCPAAGTRPARLILWTGTTGKTPRSGAGRGLSLANEFLAQNNRPERIDHRSHAARGMDEMPTVHMGVATLDDVRVEMQEGKTYQ